MDHLEGDGGTYTSGGIMEKCVRKSESGSQNRVWRDGRVRHRERCSTGLHPVSFVIQHLRRENNEISFRQMGRRNLHRRKKCNEFDIHG